MYKIGFIGLGSMGFHMASNLIKAGFEVTGFNRTKSKEEKLAVLGATRVANLAELASSCDIIVDCLPDEKVVYPTIFGEDGLLSAPLPRFRYYINCSTIDVTAAENIGAELLGKGIFFFDSPVSGGTAGAESGTLTIMVGGDRTAMEEVMPVYKAMGKNIMYFGPNGCAIKIKLINQILSWVNHAVICEAAVLAKKANLDLDKMYDALMVSWGYSRIFEACFKTHIQPEDYSSSTPMTMMVKDLTLAKRFADAYGAKLPMTDASMVMYLKAVEDGYGSKDQSIIMEQLK